MPTDSTWICNQPAMRTIQVFHKPPHGINHRRLPEGGSHHIADTRTKRGLAK
jgi:Icc-related predicted phosphoesterase